MQYQVTVATDADPFYPISGRLGFAAAKSAMEEFRKPGEALPLDRRGRRLSIVVLQKVRRASGPAQCSLPLS